MPRASSSFYFVKLCMQLITGYNMHRTDRSLMNDFTFWIRAKWKPGHGLVCLMKARNAAKLTKLASGGERKQCDFVYLENQSSELQKIFTGLKTVANQSLKKCG